MLLRNSPNRGCVYKFVYLQWCHQGSQEDDSYTDLYIDACLTGISVYSYIQGYFTSVSSVKDIVVCVAVH